MSARELARLARRQRGLFTRADARRCGFADDQIRRRVGAGEWRRVVGPVLTVGSANLTQTHLDLAAQLAVPGSVLTGPAAARAWGMPVDDDRVMVVVKAGRRVRVPGVLVAYGLLGPREIVLSDGARITQRDRAVFDCLRIMAERPGLDLLDRALQQGWVTLDSLSVQIARHVGQHGVPKVRRLVRLVSGGERSAAERVFTGLLQSAGLTGWQVNAPICDRGGLIALGDVVFEAEQVVIEVDGWAHHSTAERFQRDRSRQNRLVRAGWTVLRFTWRDLTERPGQVLATLRAILDAARRPRRA